MTDTLESVQWAGEIRSERRKHFTLLCWRLSRSPQTEKVVWDLLRVKSFKAGSDGEIIRREMFEEVSYGTRSGGFPPKYPVV